LNTVFPASVSFREAEQKRYLKWSDDGTKIFYENYKNYVISNEHTCPECSWNDMMTIPNPSGIGAAADIKDPIYNLTKVAQNILGFGLLLLGEYPFVSHTVKEILFDGYNDPLLDVGHSEIVYFLSGVLNGGKSIIPIPIPDMPHQYGLLQYNNSRDENYWIESGKADINQIDSGSFCKMHLEKTDELPFFQSFMCRSFTKTFLEEKTIQGIPSYTFYVPYDDYDTTADVNAGFRYKNVEKVNYFPDWPSCPDRDPHKCENLYSVDCSLQNNLCHNCCNGSFVDGTYLIPPGIFPLVCYPGRLQPTPFAVMYSPPHFLYSPPQVINSVIGVSPNNESHLPMVYSHEPMCKQYFHSFDRVLSNIAIRFITVKINLG
uniref:Lysosome membrane protein 2 n=1 Tax=Haemonchus placei TaxID=6290 RepID=A0A0N4WTW8_HAEPC